MWKIQKMFEENVTVINELEPVISSGGISTISYDSGVTIKMVMLPDENRYRENRKDGIYQYEKLFAHVRKDEMEKVEVIPGKSQVIWNGETYRVVTKLPYESKQMFQIAEIEMRRKIDVD